MLNDYNSNPRYAAALEILKGRIKFIQQFATPVSCEESCLVLRTLLLAYTTLCPVSCELVVAFLSDEKLSFVAEPDLATRKSWYMFEWQVRSKDTVFDTWKWSHVSIPMVPKKQLDYDCMGDFHRQ